MKAAFLVVGFLFWNAAPFEAGESSDLIGSSWWIASRRDPGILRNSIGEVRSFRISGEKGEFYNLELPNGQASTLRKEWLHKAIEDKRLVSSKPAEGTQWWIRKPGTILDITLGKTPGPFTISGEPRGFYYIVGPDGRTLGQIPEATFDRYVQEKVLVNYDPAEEIQAEIRQQKAESQKKESNAKLAAAKARTVRIEAIKAKKWPADIEQAVIDKRDHLGMTDEQVRVSIGKPQKINESGGTWGTHQQWVYGSTYLYFENGILRSYQASR